MRLAAFFVVLAGVSGLGAVPAGAQTSTITLSFTDTLDTALTAVNENNGAATVRVVATASSAPSSNVSVTVTVGASGGTATSGACTGSGMSRSCIGDYEVSASSVTVTISSGATSGSADVTVTPYADTVTEGHETIKFTGSASGHTVNGADLTITDDDIDIVLSVEPTRVGESASAQTVTVTAAFAGTSSILTSATDVTVTVAGGTNGATLGASGDFTTDKTNNQFTVTIPAGGVSGTATFQITARADGTYEGPEKVTLSGTATVSGTAVTTSAELTILDAFFPITLSLTDTSDSALTAVGEDNGATTVRVVATVPSAPSASLDFGVMVSGGTASANDYTVSPSGMMMTIAAGATSVWADVTVTPVSDTVTEDHETIRFAGSEGFESLLGRWHSVTGADLEITDADRTITLTWDDHAFAETDATSGTVSITGRTLAGTLSGTTSTLSAAVNVRARIEAGTATCCSSINDVSWAHETMLDPKYLNIPAGSVSATITGLTVDVRNDQAAEPVETFYIRLDTSDFTVNRAEGTIADMDSVVLLTPVASSLAEGSDGSEVNVSAAFGAPGGTAATTSEHATGAQFTLSVTADTAGTADFTYAPSVLNTVTIPANTTVSTTSATLAGLSVVDDDIAEGRETLKLGGDLAGFQYSGSLDIDDDDDDIKLSLEPRGVLESASPQTVTLTAAFAGASSSTLTAGTDVTVTVASGTGTYGATLGSSGDFTTDATGNTFTVTIAAGDVNGTAALAVTAPDDNAAEGTETAALTGIATVAGSAVTVTAADLQIADEMVTVTMSVLDEDDEPLTRTPEGSDTEIKVKAALPDGVSAISPLTVEVTVGQPGDGAHSGRDYQPVEPFDITIAAGTNNAEAVFTLATTDDRVYEGDETLHIAYAPRQFAVSAINSSLLKIIDDDSIPVPPPTGGGSIQPPAIQPPEQPPAIQPPEQPPATQPPECQGRFCDEDQSVHQTSINTIAQWGITVGCDARDPTRFCPDQPITRRQMAAFLYRAVIHQTGTPPTGADADLADVPDDAWYATYAQWAVSIGAITPDGGDFEGAAEVTRADMAAMLIAAFPYLNPDDETLEPEGLFADMAGQDPAHILAVEALYWAGVTKGCATNPLRYCPDRPVSRAQMASFFVRTLNINPSLTN